MEARNIVHLVCAPSEADRHKPFLFENDTLWNKWYSDHFADLDRELEESLNQRIDDLKRICDQQLAVDDQNYMPTVEEIALEDDRNALHQQIGALNDVWVIQAGLEEAKVLNEIGEFVQSRSSVDKIRSKVASFAGSFPGTRLEISIMNEIDELARSIDERIDSFWEKSLIWQGIDDKDQDVSLDVKKNGVEDVAFESIYEAIEEFRPAEKEMLLSRIENYIFLPVLECRIWSAEIIDTKLVLRNKGNFRRNPRSLVNTLEQIIEYFVDSFESSGFAAAISKRFSTWLINKMMTTSLPLMFPESSCALPGFRQELQCVGQFEAFLGHVHWGVFTDLSQWVDQLSMYWVSHRKILCCEYLRRAFSDTKFTTLKVSISLYEELPSSQESLQGPIKRTSETSKQSNGTEEWGWDDNEDQNNQDNNECNEDSNQDDWGWGDETEDKPQDDLNQAEEEFNQVCPQKSPVHAAPVPVQMATISCYVQTVECAISMFLEQVDFDTDAGRHLSDILAVYRALAPIIYSQAPELVLYNDLTLLIERLRSKVETRDLEYMSQLASRHQSGIVHRAQAALMSKLNLSNGFVDCNEAANLSTCQRAVRESVAVIRASFKDWLQYSPFPTVCKMGSILIEQLVSGMIASIEGLSDISEVESRELSGLIKQVCELEDVFSTGGASGDKNSGSLAAFYVTSWIKFQYLGEILESSLVDIQYLYNNDALVDFTSAELVRLIRALFSDSEYRERTIKEIRGE